MATWTRHDEWLLCLFNDELEANDQQTTSSVEIFEMKILGDYLITSVVKTQINVQTAPFSIEMFHINMRLSGYCQLLHANYKSNTKNTLGECQRRPWRQSGLDSEQVWTGESLYA